MQRETQQGNSIHYMTPAEALEGAEVNLEQSHVNVMAEMIIQGGWTAPLKLIVNAEGEALGFAYGLGRVAALAWMERQHASNPQLFPAPEGIQVNDQGEWEFPYERFSA
jgi:hypothetical protein